MKPVAWLRCVLGQQKQMKSGLSQNPDLQGVQIWQMGEQFGRDVAELRALQRPICINQKKSF